MICLKTYAMQGRRYSSVIKADDLNIQIYTWVTGDNQQVFYQNQDG